MLALRLLELQKEFSEFDSTADSLSGLGLGTVRTREDITREYEFTLREFVTSSASALGQNAVPAEAK